MPDDSWYRQTSVLDQGLSSTRYLLWWWGAWSEPGLHRTVPWAASCSWWKLLDLLLSAPSSMCHTGRAAPFWISRAWPSIFYFYRVAVPFCSNNNWQTEGLLLLLPWEQPAAEVSAYEQHSWWTGQSTVTDWLTHTHTAFHLYSRRGKLSRIWKFTHLESYNCLHIRDNQDTVGTQSYHSLLYRIANGFVCRTQSYRVM